MSREESLRDSVLYTISKGKTNYDDIAEIIYIADLYHLLNFGRTIIESIKDFKYHIINRNHVKNSLEKDFPSQKDLANNYPYLSETDKKSLDFAMIIFDLIQSGDIIPIPKIFIQE